MKKRTKDLLMLLSFVGASAFTYIFHIIQAKNNIRKYTTAASLLVAYFCAQKTNDVKIKNLWSVFFAWTLQSVVYYEAESHVHGSLRFIKHIVVAVLALISIVDKHKLPTEILLMTVFALAPDVSSNLYGNAMFSILRLFTATVILLLDKKDTKYNEIIWIFMCHEIILSFAIIQLILKVLPVTTTDKFPWMKWKSQQPSDVITADHVPFLVGSAGYRGSLNI